MDSVYPNLCAELSKANISVSRLAEELNIPEDVACSKLRGESPWLLPEAVNICQLCNTPDVNFLFLQLV